MGMENFIVQLFRLPCRRANRAVQGGRRLRPKQRFAGRIQRFRPRQRRRAQLPGKAALRGERFVLFHEQIGDFPGNCFLHDVPPVWLVFDSFPA